MAAGYSGTPLPAKLGIEPGQRAWLVDVPADVEARLDASLAETTRLARISPFDFALVFVASRATLASALDRLAPKLDDAGMIWIAWPKKASRVKTDMTEDASDDTYPVQLHPDHHALVTNPSNWRQFFDLGPSQALRVPDAGPDVAAEEVIDARRHLEEVLHG